MRNSTDTSRAILAVLICFALCISACNHKPANKTDHPQLVAGVRMQDVTFHCTALDREMQYRVFLPENLAISQKLPVVYLLHGGDGGFRDWSNYSDVAKYALHGIILVMPQGDMSYYMNAVGSPKDKYQDYITKDLVADVESHFPAKHDRESRAIIGISMGGFAAIKFALSDPELYIFAGALSPSIDMPRRHFNFKYIGQWWRIRRIFGPFGSEERARRDPFELVQTANPQLTPYIYLTVGEQEPLHGPNSRFAMQLKQNIN